MSVTLIKRLLDVQAAADYLSINRSWITRKNQSKRLMVGGYRIVCAR